MDYDGVYYCIFCGAPMHIIRIMQQENCECGRFGFISFTSFNIKRIIDTMED